MPDGKTLVHAGANREQGILGIEHLDRNDATDCEPEHSRRNRAFDITADGTQIVFDRLRENSDIVLIERAGHSRER